ncbi:hypothetical protein Goklo_028951 [Gossypium klotzschianum]|uniref:Uncharacterized protein n=1 Tax=Gossypium klotzschianum TaxID=34286 RepID=A0A7J8WAA5_9ROSI|nr:hypothetical protein [Gossypium klotzschianum]
MRQSLTCSIDLIRGLHRSQQFWQKRSGCKMLARERVKVDSLDVRSFYSHDSTITSRRLIRFRIGSSLKIIHH